MPRLLLLFAFSFAFLGVQQQADAETVRFAVVVGHNAGREGRTPLRFAEVDAGKVARVLVSLGGVKPENLSLLQGRTPKDVRKVMGEMTAKIKQANAVPGRRVVLTVYYSGHSDGVHLELGSEALPFKEVKRWLKRTRADVRLLIVDSCKSGSLVAAKGAKRGPDFDISYRDEINTKGEVTLTSSAADEIALESEEVGGSFFTHHLVSAMRGAGDASSDGRVTLSEAYQYAYQRTVSASGSTLGGAQHPNFDYRLSGSGELVLTDLTTASAAVKLPRRFDRAILISRRRDQVEAELTNSKQRTVAVVPGPYALYLWRKKRAFVANFSVDESSSYSVSEQDLREVSESGTLKKGGRLTASLSKRYRAQLALGGQSAIATDVLYGSALSLGWHPSYWVWGGLRPEAYIGASWASGRGQGFRETQVQGWVVGGLGRQFAWLTPFVHLGVQAGVVRQNVDQGTTQTSSSFGLRSALGARARIGDRWDVNFQGTFTPRQLRVDQETETEFVWGANMGVGLRF